METRALALILLWGCSSPARPGPVARLAHDGSDTVVVNSRYATPLRLRALDASGATVLGATVRTVRVGGDPIPVDSNGHVTCTQSGTVHLLATAGAASTYLTVLCRVVEYVQVPGPLQFVLGDSALGQPRPVRVEAYDRDARLTAPIMVTIGVKDTTIAFARGAMLFPRRRGITTLGARAGDRDVGTGVHVYQRVGSLAALDTLLRMPPALRLFAVPLEVAPGEVRRQRLPPGIWMLTMLPESDTAASRTRLRVEGSRCQEHLLNTPRRWGCTAGTEATVILYREPATGSRGNGQVEDSSSYLLVRWLFT